jgi:hypothetical protein
MKITDEILIDIGFVYDKERDEFIFKLSSFTVVISKTDKYWMYLQFKHPGYEVATIEDIIKIISSYSIKLGVELNRKDIKNALGL